MKRTVVLALTCVVICGWGPPFSHLKSAVPKSAVPKSAVEEAQYKLGSLEAWQKLLYHNEVIPQYQRFIRTYANSGNHIQVEIDYQGLKNYLAFYGPKMMKQKDPKILVLLRPDSTCQKCMESLPAVKSVVQSRLENRGFIFTENVSPQSGAKTDIAGEFVLQWSPLPPDDLDTAHVDEDRYKIRTNLKLKNFEGRTRQKELFKTDSFEDTAGSILADIFTELGAEVDLQRPVEMENGIQEHLLEVSNLKDFFQYSRVKNLLSETLRSISTSFEERKFSRGRVTFAIYSKNLNADVKKKIQQAILNSEPDFPVRVEFQDPIEWTTTPVPTPAAARGIASGGIASGGISSGGIAK